MDKGKMRTIPTSKMVAHSCTTRRLSKNRILQQPASKAVLVACLGMWILTTVAAEAGLPETGKNRTVSFSLQDKNAGDLLAQKWGIRLLPLRSTAAGNMLDFRYRVLDARKSAALFRRETKPYLLHQRSGKVLAVPNTAKIGPLRNSDTPQEGRNYWMFFRNTGHLVSKGDKVTVIIGEFRVEDIVVE